MEFGLTVSTIKRAKIEITDYANDDMCNSSIHPNEKYFFPKEFFVKE